MGLGNVDVPTSIGGIVPVIGKKFYLLLGVRYSALSHYPFYPILGAIYVFNNHLRIEARPPTPRIIYSYNKKLDFYVGAELLGSAYKRDDNVSARPQDRRFNNGVVDFSETRVGGGITYLAHRPDRHRLRRRLQHLARLRVLPRRRRQDLQRRTPRRTRGIAVSAEFLKRSCGLRVARPDATM